jgi:hypothetical protein
VIHAISACLRSTPPCQKPQQVLTPITLRWSGRVQWGLLEALASRSGSSSGSGPSNRRLTQRQGCARSDRPPPFCCWNNAGPSTNQMFQPFESDSAPSHLSFLLDSGWCIGPIHGCAASCALPSSSVATGTVRRQDNNSLGPASKATAVQTGIQSATTSCLRAMRASQ